MRIVGVIRGERVQRNLRLPMEPVAYVPLTQSPRREINLIVRTTGHPAASVPAIRDAVRQMDARLALSRVRTMDADPAAAQPVRHDRARVADRHVRGDRRAARRTWPLRRARAHRAAAAAGDRHPHGARRDRREILSHVLTNAGLMVAAGLAGGLARRARAHENPVEPAVRGVAARPRRARLGGRPDGRRRARGRRGLPALRAARVDPQLCSEAKGSGPEATVNPSSRYT